MSHFANSSQHPNVLNFSDDSTLHLPVRDGDFFIFCYFKGMLSNPDDLYRVADIWEMRDGDRVTITNRPCDLPDWFELHPTEVCGRLVYEMMKKLKNGHQPKEKIDGPNIWRVRDGDRLIWMGESRTGYQADLGLLKIFNFSILVLTLMLNHFNILIRTTPDTDAATNTLFLINIRFAFHIGDGK